MSEEKVQAPESATLERARKALEGIPHEVLAPRDGMACVALARDALKPALQQLRDQAGFEQSTLVTAVDHLPATPRFEMVYQLLSVSHGDRLRIKTRLEEQDARVPSITDLWPGASFFEREVWDMFGIRFDGLENHQRLLMPEGYEHHPLRKDFPQEGIEPDRLYREWDRERRKNWSEEG